MFIKKIPIVLSLITIIKLDCAETTSITFEDPNLCRSVACQTDDDNLIFPRSKNSDLFVNGNFNPEYEFSKTEIAQLAAITFILGCDSTVNLLASMAYSAGEVVLCFANIFFKYR